MIKKIDKKNKFVSIFNPETGFYMKIRTDYVTNSSSSSFICVAKVDKSAKLLKYFKEEYGK